MFFPRGRLLTVKEMKNRLEQWKGLKDTVFITCDIVIRSDCSYKNVLIEMSCYFYMQRFDDILIFSEQKCLAEEDYC